jgi:hypothetical protein
MRPNASADLVDLPLRDTTADTPRPEIAPVAAVSPARKGAPPRAFQRRRDARTARLGVVAGLMGATGLLGAAVLVGGWLVRAQDRDAPEAATIAPAAAPATTIPLATIPPVTAAPALPRARPAASRTVAAVAPRAAASLDEPSAEVMTVRPHVAAAPVDVERARDDDEPEPSAEGPDVRARPALRARLDRALEHRDAVAERVRDLRARANVPVVKDVDEYQRLQQDLSAALDELDRADAQVRRLQRALRRE